MLLSEITHNMLCLNRSFESTTLNSVLYFTLNVCDVDQKLLLSTAVFQVVLCSLTV